MNMLQIRTMLMVSLCVFMHTHTFAAQDDLRKLEAFWNSLVSEGVVPSKTLQQLIQYEGNFHNIEQQPFHRICVHYNHKADDERLIKTLKALANRVQEFNIYNCNSSTPQTIDCSLDNFTLYNVHRLSDYCLRQADYSLSEFFPKGYHRKELEKHMPNVLAKNIMDYLEPEERKSIFGLIATDGLEASRKCVILKSVIR